MQNTTPARESGAILRQSWAAFAVTLDATGKARIFIKLWCCSARKRLLAIEALHAPPYSALPRIV
jgi:hypothetical protein